MVSILGWLKGDDLKAEGMAFELRNRVAELEQKSVSADAVRAALMGGDSGSGAEETVTLERALLCSTVLACARVIAEGLAQVPCKVLKEKQNGGKEDAAEHPLYRLLHRKPNDWQTSFEFREQIGLHLALCGNAFVFVNRNAKGQPIELLAYEPGQIEMKREGYVTRYFVKIKGGKQEIPAKSMWHIRGPSMDGWQGLDAIKVARESIGLALATQKFGRNLFKNGAMPSGLLSTDQSLTAEQIDALKASWQATMSGVNNGGKTAVMMGGMKYAPLSVAPDNAQFLQTRKLQIEEICRVFRVLPIKIMHNENATSYNSLEQQNLAHYSDTLAPWFERFEQSAENNLLTDAEVAAGYCIKFNTRGFFKASAKERADYYSIMRQNGLMTVNECRDAEDMDRVDDPLANQITPAANLYGPTQAPANNTGDNNSGDTTNE